MDHLWSPWRMQYIQEAKEEPDGGGCVFCAIPETEAERVLARGELAYVVLNKFPYNPGHVLVVPIRHVGDLEDVTAGGERRAPGAPATLDRRHPADGGPARLQRRTEPRADRRERGSPSTSTGTSFPAGAATRTSCPSSATHGCCRSCSRRRTSDSSRDSTDDRDALGLVRSAGRVPPLRDRGRGPGGDADPPGAVGLADLGSRRCRCSSMPRSASFATTSAGTAGPAG